MLVARVILLAALMAAEGVMGLARLVSWVGVRDWRLIWVREFQFLQAGHWPDHLVNSLPQEEQRKREVFGLGMGVV